MDIKKSSYEDGHRVPSYEPDRGERAELDAILEEAGYKGYIEDQIEIGERTRAVEMLRDVMLDVINPPKGTGRVLQLIVIGYAIGVPGLPTMGRVAIELGLGKSGKAAISKRVVRYTDDHGLPPSPYMKSAKAREIYTKTNQKKRKQ